MNEIICALLGFSVSSAVGLWICLLVLWKQHFEFEHLMFSILKELAQQPTGDSAENGSDDTENEI